MSTTIKTALSTFQGALSAFEAAKADAHAKHLAAEAACTGAMSSEAAAALSAVGAASKLGFSSLGGELALLDISVGGSTPNKDAAAAKVTELDAALKTLEAARFALDKARATLDTAIDGERSRALTARAKLAGICGETKKS